LLFIIHIRKLGLTNQVVSFEFLVVGSYFSILVVIIDEYKLFFKVKLSFLDLRCSWKSLVELKLLSHLADFDLFSEMVLL